MATVTGRFLNINEGAAYCECVYDDVTMICTRIQWVNNQPTPVKLRIERFDGSAVLFDGTVAAGSSGSRNLNPQQRFNIETEFPRINLAG